MTSSNPSRIYTLPSPPISPKKSQGKRAFIKSTMLSSAIIVQGLANDIVKGSLFSRLLKEVGLSLINGVALGGLLIVFGYFLGIDTLVSFTIALSMLCVIVVSALIGTFVPIILDKNNIDPAIATGPFITTSNDIFGIFLFFYIAKIILGF